MRSIMKKKYGLHLMLAVFVLAAGIFFGSTQVKAAGNYSIQVNKTTNVVTVYTLDGTPVKAFVCSVGNATPVGTFHTQAKYIWKELYFSSYGQYSTRITGSILFHSVPYNSVNKAAQSYYAYNKLGVVASHGCIRLTVADAKWIYDNCPVGTTVNIINGSAANDPLGKPVAMHIPMSGQGWDPTDPDPANPYASAMPHIDAAADSFNVSYGSEFNPYAYVTAYDSLNNIVSGSMAIGGGVNTRALGGYNVSYSVTDALGRSASRVLTFLVVDDKPAAISGVKSKLTREYNSSIKVKSKVTAKTVDGTNLTKKIKIKVIYPGSKKEKTFKGNKFTFKKIGTYKINYYVTNTHNNKVTKKSCKVTVRDTKAPVVKGVKSKKTVEYKSKMNYKKGITAKLVSGKSVLSATKVYIKAPSAKSYKKLNAKSIKSYQFTKIGKYYVKYVATNPTSKKTTTKKMTVTVRDTKAPVVKGVKTARTQEYKSKLNLKKGITAKLVSGKSVLSTMKVYVKAPSDKSYKLLKDASAKSYTFTKVGTYQIKYVAVNATSKKTTIKTTKIKVQDTKAPVLTGDFTDQTAEYGSSVNLLAGIKAGLVSGKDLTAAVTVAVKLPGTDTFVTLNGADEMAAYVYSKTGEYQIRYAVTNPTGNKQTESIRKVLVQDTAAPVLTLDETLQAVYDETLACYQMQLDLADQPVFDPSKVTAALVSGTAVDSAQIRLQVTNEAGDVLTADENGIYNFTAAGIYTVAVTAANPLEASHTTSLTIRIEVTDLTNTPSTNSSDGEDNTGIETVPDTEAVTEEATEEASEVMTEEEPETETEGITEEDQETETGNTAVEDTETEEKMTEEVPETEAEETTEEVTETEAEVF